MSTKAKIIIILLGNTMFYNVICISYDKKNGTRLEMYSIYGFLHISLQLAFHSEIYFFCWP